MRSTVDCKPRSTHPCQNDCRLAAAIHHSVLWHGGHKAHALPGSAQGIPAHEAVGVAGARGRHSHLVHPPGTLLWRHHQRSQRAQLRACRGSKPWYRRHIMAEASLPDLSSKLLEDLRDSPVHCSQMWQALDVTTGLHPQLQCRGAFWGGATPGRKDNRPCCPTLADA